MDEKQLQMLFNEYGKSNGFADYNEFKSLMANPSSRKLFFDESNKDLGFKDFNEFNAILGFDSQEVKQQKQPAIPGFMDIGSQTQQTIQTAQQKVPKVQQQEQPKLQGGARDIMAGFGVRSDLTPNQEQQQYLQSSVEATKVLQEQNKKQAVQNTAALYFENNPIELKGIGIDKGKQKTGLAAAGKEAGKFSLQQLQSASPFNKKVAELQSKLDSGELTVYPANNGELRLAYKADGLTNYIEGLKDAYYAKGKAEKILSMDFDEFKKFVEESKVDDKAYLPEKADQQSTLYGFGQASLMAGKGAAGAAIGSVLAAGAPTTGGLSTAGLPAVMAWAATVPDMATQMQAFSLVDYYNRAKQENPLISDREAFEMAKNQSRAAYVEQLATGTVMAATGFASLPANTGQGLWKAVGQFAKNQPRALGETGLAVGAGSVSRDLAARQFGFNVTDQEIYDNAYNQIRQEITEDLAFNIGIGSIHAPGYVKAQAKGVLSKMPPEKLEQALQAAVQQGTITEEQAVKTAQGLAEFKAAESRVPETLPEEKRNAIAGLFEQRTKVEQEQKEALARLDPIFHDEVKKEYENQLSAINDKIKAIKDADDIFEFEQDNLTGQKANVLDTEQVAEITETPTENEIQETQVIQQKADEYKRLVEPEKPISEMNSEELYNLAIENRKALKKQDFEFKDKTEAEKEAEGYYNVIDDVEDLRDASERINFIENAENSDDIANSIKSIIPKIINNKPNEYQLAILNAAKRKTVELNINPKEVVKSILKKVASQYEDIEDAKAMVLKYFETLTKKPKADEGTITESEVIEGRLPESKGEIEPITTEKESIAETKPIEPIQEEPKAQPIGDENIVNYEDAIKITPTSELTNPEKYGTDELGMEAKTAALRDEEKTPPKFNKYEVGTYAKDKYGDLYQLQNVPIEKIVLPEGEQKRKETIDKYKKWYKEGNEFPPAKGVENYAVYKGKVVINDGHHRVVAAKQLGLKEVPVWVSLTDPKNPARPIQDVSYHKSLSTKAQPIEQPEQQTQQPTVSNPQPIKEEVSITTEPESQPIQQTEEGVENIPIQQEGVEAATQTEPKNLSTKARQYAAKLRSGEEKVLPDWLQASLPKGTKKQGIGINEAFAKALEKFADIYDTTKNFAQAVDEGFQKIKDWFDENKIPYNEAELKEKFAQDRQGEIPTESQPPPPSEPPVSEQGEGKGFRHADTEKIRERSGLEPYQKIPETIQGWIDEARQRIKDGYNVEALLNRVEKGVMPDAVEQNIIGEYLMYLDEQVKANPSDENIAKLKRVVEISDKVGGSEIAKSLVARRGSRLPDDSLGNFFIQQMEATGANVLTENQKQVNTKEFEEIQAANNEYKEKVKILEEEVAKLKAQKEIDEVRKKSQPSKTKKTHEDYVKERQDIIKQMREDLLKVAKGSGGLQSSIPGAAQLKAIAPHVGKLVKSLVDENYTKLEEVVKLVYNEVKDIVEGITEKDIQNIIAGDYSEKKQTRSNLAATLRDLKTEAKLLGELERLQNGVEPKVERQKQIRNKRITDLQNQIKELRKQQYVREKEFDKFYTEDLDAEFKKLAALRKRTESEIAKVEEKIKKGDFAPEERKPLLLNPELKKKYPEEFKKAVEAKDKLIKLKQEREIRLLKEKYANRTKYQKIQDAVVEVSNVPRAIMASVDFSAPLRQGIITTVAYPTISMKAAVEMFKQAFSQKAFDRWFYDVKEHPRYELAKKSTLHLADPHDPKLSAKEEQFMSNLAEKIPVIGRLVKGSERAYIAFLNKVRWDVFNRMADAYESEGKTFENSEKLYRETGDYINTVTGRGTLGKFEESAQVLNAAFFSPRLIASRVKLLTNFANPNFYYNVPKEVRVQYFKDMAKFLGAGLSVLTLAKLYQEAFGSDEEDEKVTVEVDPRSSDFGKIKVGNTRYDIWGGFQPYVRLMAQMFTGQRKTTTTGEIQNLQPKQKFQTASNFFRGKLAPVPASGVDIITGENVTGDRVQPLEELTSMLIPLTFQDLSEAIKDKGVSAIFTTGIPSTFGIGTQTYTNTSTLEGLYDRNLTSKQTMDINKITKYENGFKKPITKDEFKKFTQKRDSLIQEGLDQLYKNGQVYVKNREVIKKSFEEMTPIEVQDEIKKIKTSATKKAKEELFPIPDKIKDKLNRDLEKQELLRERMQRQQKNN